VWLGSEICAVRYTAATGNIHLLESRSADFIETMSLANEVTNTTMYDIRIYGISNYTISRHLSKRRRRHHRDGLRETLGGLTE